MIITWEVYNNKGILARSNEKGGCAAARNRLVFFFGIGLFEAGIRESAHYPGGSDLAESIHGQNNIVS